MDLSTPWSGVGRSTLGLYRWLSLLCMFWAVKVSDGESWARAQSQCWVWVCMSGLSQIWDLVFAVLLPN